MDFRNAAREQEIVLRLSYLAEGARTQGWLIWDRNKVNIAGSRRWPFKDWSFNPAGFNADIRPNSRPYVYLLQTGDYLHGWIKVSGIPTG